MTPYSWDIDDRNSKLCSYLHVDRNRNTFFSLSAQNVGLETEKYRFL